MIDLRVGEEALVAGGHGGIVGAKRHQVLVETSDGFGPVLERELRVSEIVENFGARAVEQLVLLRRVKRDPLIVTLLLEEQAQQAGVGHLARFAVRIILARDAEKFFRVIRLPGLQG